MKSELWHLAVVTSIALELGCRANGASVTGAFDAAPSATQVQTAEGMDAREAAQLQAEIKLAQEAFTAPPSPEALRLHALALTRSSLSSVATSCAFDVLDPDIWHGSGARAACERCARGVDKKVDGWGTHLRATCSDGGAGIVTSAGEDRFFGSPDDKSLGFVCCQL
jgi:hypothetical protein